MQPDSTEKPENSASVWKLQKQVDAKEGEVLVDYEPDVDYELEEPDPNDELLAQKEEKETPKQMIWKGSFLAKRLLDKGHCTIKYKIRFSMYMQHKDLR